MEFQCRPPPDSTAQVSDQRGGSALIRAHDAVEPEPALSSPATGRGPLVRGGRMLVARKTPPTTSL